MLINQLFKFVIRTSALYNIDESHALKHSMDVYQYANTIFHQEVINKPYLMKQKLIIDSCAILHDMCDNKYVDETIGIKNINDFLINKLQQDEIYIINQIIQTMSYSKVKKNGYPIIPKYQDAYHIVRQADLLAAYDIDRAIIYGMMVKDQTYEESLSESIQLFDKRVLQHITDNLFYHESAIEIGKKLHQEAELKIAELCKNKIYKIYK